MHSKEVAIIVAGGKGLRLPGDIPKQFIEIGGLPVLMHTINAFRDYSASIDIIIVLPLSEIALWDELCLRHGFKQNITVVRGGSSRFQSVKNGLGQISGSGFVAIHDGVRPLITPDIIAASFHIARKYRSAVASVPLKESIRQVEDTSTAISATGEPGVSSHRSVALDRTKFRLMQTPQTFDIELLKAAYDAARDDSFTDDASVAESAGYSIALYDGSYENIKITTPEDLILAEAIMRAREARALR